MLCYGSTLYHTQLITQPLYDSSADKDTAFQGIRHLAIQLPGNRRQQIVLRQNRAASRIQNHETARPVSCLDHADIRTKLSEQGGLLVARHTGHRNTGLENRRRSLAIDFAAAFHFGHHRGRNMEKLKQFIVPLLRMNIEQHCAGSIRDVRNKFRPARQLPDQPGIDRSETELSTFSPLADTFHMIQNPAYLGRGKIGIDHQACLLLDHRSIPLCLQLLAIIGRTPVLPDDGVIDRETGFAIPYDRRFALIGNTDTSDMGIRHIRFCHRFLDGGRLRVPDLVRIMLHPAGFREILLKRFLRQCDDSPLVVEKDRP